MSDTNTYRRIFKRANEAPWTCCFCDGSIWIGTGKSKFSLIVHHRNEDRQDDRVENLAGSHRRCHSRYHATNVSDETRARMAKGNRGNRNAAGSVRSPAERANLAEKSRGNTNRRGAVLSLETRQKISASKRGKPWSAARRAASTRDVAQGERY